MTTYVGPHGRALLDSIDEAHEADMAAYRREQLRAEFADYTEQDWLDEMEERDNAYVLEDDYCMGDPDEWDEED